MSGAECGGGIGWIVSRFDLVEDVWTETLAYCVTETDRLREVFLAAGIAGLVILFLLTALVVGDWGD